MKRILAINAGPRTGWNTDQLIRAAAAGARDAGAGIVPVELYRLERYTGCVSCFGCKRQETFGKCVCRDGLYDVLEAIDSADALIIGSPNYLGELTASFRALYERLIFRSLTYNAETPCCNRHRIPVLLIMTSGTPEEQYDDAGCTAMLEKTRQTLDAFVGPTELLCCGDTLQVSDYSAFDWTVFDPEAKKRRHDETFGGYLSRAYELGSALCRD